MDRIGLVVLAVVALVVGGGVVHRLMQDQESTYATRIAAYRRAMDVAVAYADSVGQHNLARQDTIRRLERELERLRRTRPDTTGLGAAQAQAESVYTTLRDSVQQAFGGLIPLQRTLIWRQDTVIRWQARVIVQQDTLLGVKASVIADLTTVNDSLRAVLLRPPPLPPKRRLFGVLPYPSRTVSAIGGLLVGVATGGVLVRR